MSVCTFKVTMYLQQMAPLSILYEMNTTTTTNNNNNNNNIKKKKNTTILQYHILYLLRISTTSSGR